MSVFNTLGASYGFHTVEVAFSLDATKVKYRKSSNWISLQLPKEFENAPEPILFDLAEYIFRGICEGDAPMSNALKSYVRAMYVQDRPFAQATFDDYCKGVF